MSPKSIMLLAFIIGGVVFIKGISSSNQLAQAKGTLAQVSTSSSSSIDSLSPQQKQMGVVSVEVTPGAFDGSQNLTFSLTLNNHSVDLAYDYTQIAKLIDDQGQTYSPIEWNGNSSGHHVRGDLIFAPLPTQPKNLTLRLSGIDNVTEDFFWQL